MNTKISPADFSGLSETLLIPLWAKAVEYRRTDALLRDEEAARMLDLIDYDFSRFETAKMSQVGCCARAAIIDSEVCRFLNRNGDGVVVQLGAGLDARFERVGRPPVTAWYDLDLPEVMAVRRCLLPESGNHYLDGSMFDEEWAHLAAVHGKPVLVVIEGVLMYFDEKQVRAFFEMLWRILPQAVLVADLMSGFGLKKAAKHDALRHMDDAVRPEFKWGVAEPEDAAKLMPGLETAAVHSLADKCGRRYPLWLRLLYKTGWGRRNLDMKVVRLEQKAV
ncbi:class I SAM-dependent methyltransferase [Neisseria sp. CCUG12390]|uniref:class I SAM-dependent methyltransferase n=1 Tax=Neisseria sp. CCUG12390 TaxID=3392035 RepID=UPI003A0FCD3B